MKLFLDFDRTMYDLDAMLADNIALWERYGVDRKSWIETKKGFSKGSGEVGPCYTAYLHAKKIPKLSERECRLIEQECKDLLIQGKKYVFSDVYPFLEEADRRGWEMNILTFGDFDYQTLKVQGSGLYDRFCSVIITHEDKWGEIKRRVNNLESALFIDDGKKYFENKMEARGCSGIHLIRDRIDCGCGADAHIGGLRELFFFAD